MQPDKPKLCGFWMEGLLIMLSTCKLDYMTFPKETLVAWLWKYTWAAMPEYLRAQCVAALQALVDRGYAALGSARTEGATASALVALHGCDNIAWILEGDEGFVAWAAQQTPCVVMYSDPSWREKMSQVITEPGLAREFGFGCGFLRCCAMAVEAVQKRTRPADEQTQHAITDLCVCAGTQSRTQCSNLQRGASACNRSITCCHRT